MIAEHSSIFTHDLVKEDIDGEEDAARKVSPVKLLQSTAVVSFQEAVEGEVNAGSRLQQSECYSTRAEPPTVAKFNGSSLEFSAERIPRAIHRTSSERMIAETPPAAAVSDRSMIAEGTSP